jgi:Xaa-Pro aminopeptidase
VVEAKVRDDPERTAKIVASLKGSSLDGLICSSPSDVLLLSGYWPVMGKSVAIVTADGDVHVIVPRDELALAERTSDATLTTYETAEKYRIVCPIEALAKSLRSTLLHLQLCKARVGVRMRQGMQPASYAVGTEFRSSLVETLIELHPRAEYVSCDELMANLAARKTVRELGLLRQAVGVAEAGFAAAAEAIEPGLREVEVASRIQSAFDTSPLAAYLQRSYGYFFCMSGTNSALAAAAFARTRQRQLDEGDLVMIHANTCADGFWTDITRTYTVGTPRPRHENMRTAIDEARKAALKAIHPGAAAREVDSAARKTMEMHGLGEAFKHATGHGVGFGAANPNGLPRIHPQSPDVLEEGMTFNIEPAAYFDGYGGMRHCDIVAVTSDGAAVLTEF